MALEKQLIIILCLTIYGLQVGQSMDSSSYATERKKVDEFIEAFDLSAMKHRLTNLEKMLSMVAQKQGNYSRTLHDFKEIVETIRKTKVEQTEMFTIAVQKIAEVSRRLMTVEEELAKLKQKEDDRALAIKTSDEIIKALEVMKADMLKYIAQQDDRINLCLKNLVARQGIFGHHAFYYIWKIENFVRLLQSARYENKTVLHSNPFSSNEFGYTMRIELYPNGFGDGQGTFMSVYLQIMKGHTDAILKWPIEYSAVISLIDQVNGEGHQSAEIKADSIRAVKGTFNRPLNSVNFGWGVKQFIALDQLQPLYLVDDVIFIMVDMTIK